MDIIEKQFSLLAEKLNNLICSRQGDSEEARYLIERVNELKTEVTMRLSPDGITIESKPSCQCAAMKERLDKKIDDRKRYLKVIQFNGEFPEPRLASLTQLRADLFSDGDE